MPLPVGSPAPDFTLKTKADEGLRDVRLSDNFGKRNTVLLFVPAAFTSVCTQELCDVSGGLSGYAEADAEVYGISTDSPYALDAWAKASQIGITLLSDFQHRVTRAYDVVLPDLYGLGPAAARAAFVIDREGVIRYAEQTATLDVPDFEKIQQTLRSL